MPVHWTISHPTRLVVAVAKDEVSIQDIEQYFAGVTAGGAMSYRKIFEIAATARGLDPAGLEKLGARLLYYAQHGQVGPVAIVAPTDESYAQAEIFAKAAKVRRPLAIFREMHEARHWLDAQPVEQPAKS
ncbi:hypothetical protein SAMN02745126_05004 [Enhydrobacter aerosaccus]|uniref:SpoIIAA-like n=1 Tax=Enhydrobacter aerosaccus TaxID=225324 RepID=A0A1T4SQV2_9HYPH|nr:hypothetical protein [Enhydrobacter aerosaccus]SKA30660.1 hypothetical protein SAMN02745126_05004 [Enhydrobacter aerosaccus]